MHVPVKLARKLRTRQPKKLKRFGFAPEEAALTLAAEEDQAPAHGGKMLERLDELAAERSEVAILLAIEYGEPKMTVCRRHKLWHNRLPEVLEAAREIVRTDAIMIALMAPRAKETNVRPQPREAQPTSASHGIADAGAWPGVGADAVPQDAQGHAPSSAPTDRATAPVDPRPATSGEAPRGHALLTPPAPALAPALVGPQADAPRPSQPGSGDGAIPSSDEFDEAFVAEIKRRMQQTPIPADEARRILDDMDGGAACPSWPRPLTFRSSLAATSRLVARLAPRRAPPVSREQPFALFGAWAPAWPVGPPRATLASLRPPRASPEVRAGFS